MDEKTAIYRHYDGDGALLYIGLSKNPIKRMEQHQIYALWFYSIELVKIEWFDSRQEAADAETRAIRSERPIFNTAYNRPKVKREKAALQPSRQPATAVEPTLLPTSPPAHAPTPREVADMKIGLALPDDDAGMAALIAKGVPEGGIYDGERIIDRLLKLMPRGSSIVIAPGVDFSDEHDARAQDRGVLVERLR